MPAGIPGLLRKARIQTVDGDPTENWLVLRNGTITIGLFQGMFDCNTFTFNPGWTAECEPLPEFTDVREIQKSLKAKGLARPGACPCLPAVAGAQSNGKPMNPPPARPI